MSNRPSRDLPPEETLREIVELARDIQSLGQRVEGVEACEKLERFQELLRVFHREPDGSILGQHIAQDIDGEVRDVSRPSYVRRRVSGWATVILIWARRLKYRLD